MPKIINFSGQARHGKTSAAYILKDILEERGKRVLIINYADYLKFICKEYFGWDGTKSEVGRGILQKQGTDVVRKRNPNFWVQAVGNFVDVFGEDFDFILTGDCRFVNECEYFKPLYDTINVKVTRNNFDNGLTDEQKNHPSERSLDDYGFDYELISASGLGNLKKSVEWLVEDLDRKSWIL
jgi:hypothetical protein